MRERTSTDDERNRCQVRQPSCPLSNVRYAPSGVAARIIARITAGEAPTPAVPKTVPTMAELA